MLRRFRKMGSHTILPFLTHHSSARNGHFHIVSNLPGDLFQASIAMHTFPTLCKTLPKCHQIIKFVTFLYF